MPISLHLVIHLVHIHVVHFYLIFFKICSRIYHPVVVTYVTAKDVPTFPNKASENSKTQKSGSTEKTKGLQRVFKKTPSVWMEDVRTLIAQMVGKKKVPLGYDDFVSFNEYWNELAKGNKNAAAQLADARKKN